MPGPVKIKRAKEPTHINVTGVSSYGGGAGYFVFFYTHLKNNLKNARFKARICCRLDAMYNNLRLETVYGVIETGIKSKIYIYICVCMYRVNPQTVRIR